MAWISKEQKKIMEELCLQQERYLLGLDPMPELEPVCNKKWAMIEVEGESQMQWVDNITMKAYKADGYDTTDVEIPKYKFERWCTSFDL